jgi:hypothetical protein
VLIIAAVSTTTAKPGERAFHHPAFGTSTTPVAPGGRRTTSKRHFPGEAVASPWVRA